MESGHFRYCKSSEMVSGPISLSCSLAEEEAGGYWSGEGVKQFV